MAKRKDIVIKGSYDIVKPEQMTKMANVLKSYVVKNKLYSSRARCNRILHAWMNKSSDPILLNLACVSHNTHPRRHATTISLDCTLFP